MEQRAVVCFLTLNAPEIEMELASICGDEVLQIAAVKK
jgi:hypothetical protein